MKFYVAIDFFKKKVVKQMSFALFLLSLEVLSHSQKIIKKWTYFLLIDFLVLTSLYSDSLCGLTSFYENHQVKLEMCHMG